MNAAPRLGDGSSITTPLGVGKLTGSVALLPDFGVRFALKSSERARIGMSPPRQSRRRGEPTPEARLNKDSGDIGSSDESPKHIDFAIVAEDVCACAVNDNVEIAVHGTGDRSPKADSSSSTNPNRE